MYRFIFIVFFFFAITAAGQVATPGKPLPPWQKGFLDLHHINTGRGNAAYYIFPDGTTMLFDAGEEDPSDPRTFSARNSAIHPNNKRLPYEWIVYYIKKMAPHKDNIHLDYAAISHFHDDHFGSWYHDAPPSSKGKYVLTGITGVGDNIPIQHLIDRGYPQYNYPVRMDSFIFKFSKGDDAYLRTIHNYFLFTQTQTARGFEVAQCVAGSITQIRMQYNGKDYPEFYVRNLKSNGKIWTGKDSSVFEYFPPVDPADSKTWPDENSLSLAFAIHYGPFTYYSGGDCAGNVSYGEPWWKDVETPVAKALGEVDVATMDHHGNRNAVSEFQVKTLKPRVWIGQSWSSDHPGHEVLIRATTPFLYDGPRDLFATNMLEANKLVIGSLIDQSYKSTQGHILVRVLPGGKEYYVIILDDSKEDMPVKNVFGPYQSKNK